MLLLFIVNNFIFNKMIFFKSGKKSEKTIKKMKDCCLFARSWKISMNFFRMRNSFVEISKFVAGEKIGLRGYIMRKKRFRWIWKFNERCCFSQFQSCKIALDFCHIKIEKVKKRKKNVCKIYELITAFFWPCKGIRVSILFYLWRKKERYL